MLARAFRMASRGHLIPLSHETSRARWKESLSQEPVFRCFHSRLLVTPSRRPFFSVQDWRVAMFLKRIT